MKTIAVGIFLSAVILLAVDGRKNHRASLLKEIQNHELYKHFPNVKVDEHLPEDSNGEPIILQFAMYLINVADVDHVKKEVEVDGWLRLQWNSGITWTPSHGVKSLLIPAHDMWVPDISVHNSVNKLTNDAPDFVLVTSDGQAMWMPKVRVRSLCDVDPHKMAWNVSCNLQFGPWLSSDNMVNITKLDDDGIHLEFYFAESRFQILEASSTKKTEYYEEESKDPYSFIEVQFSFKERNPSHNQGGCAQGIFAWR